MKKEELREFLDRPNVPFNTALHKVNEFIMEPNNKAIIANYIVAELKNKKNIKSKDIFSLFFLATKSLVTKTRLCNTLFAEQSLLRSAFINSQFQNIVISLVKQGYRLLPVESNTKDSEPEDELTRKQRLKRQAALMREAKARKRAEQLAKEKRVEVAQKPEEKRVEVVKKKFTKEELEQIELLKHMRN